MRGLLLLIAGTVAAGAQDTRGFVNPKLVTQNFVNNSLKSKPKVILVDPPANRMCAIPLLEVKVDQNVDPSMVIKPGKSIDEKMILPALPVCGK